MTKLLNEKNISEKTTGLYKLITFPSFYGGLQKALGATEARLRTVQDWIAPTPKSRILDLGCGPAPLVPLLQFSQYHGIDLNEDHVAHARSKYGSQTITFESGAAQELVPALEGPFDRVICSGFLHHLADEDVIGLIDILTCKLSPEGYIASVEPVFLPRQRMIARGLKLMDSGQHIRTQDTWQVLLAPYLQEQKITHDLLRLPYDHIWIKLGQPSAKTGLI